jgi:outer membrane protein TolC
LAAPGLALAVSLLSTPLAAANPALLERSWLELDQQLRALDALIPPDPQPLPVDASPTAPLPPALVAPNAPPAGPLRPGASSAPAPLSLPTPAQLQQGQIASLSLEQALAIAFGNNARLQAQRLQVAAALAQLQAALGNYWPRIAAIAAGSTGQSSLNANGPVGNTNLGLGPNFAPGGAFSVLSGGGYYQNQYANSGGIGLGLDYALIDFARTPAVQAARAQLNGVRNSYANQLRQLQLQVSEAYYQLQQADQTVRIQDAAVRNDLLILQDTLDLKQAGLVPRLDVLRRRAIEASDQEALIQAMADRAIARRQLALLLNLHPAITPAAADAITPMPRWPLDLEASLLAAYRGNPELETLLSAREALLRQRDATAAALLPKLALFANGGSSASNANTFNIGVSNGGCCGTSVVPVQNTSGYDWSLGLSLRWLLFDAGTTSGQARALGLRAQATAQEYAAQRDAIRLRLETAFFNHEASLARLSAARRGVAAAIEAFRDVRLRFQSGLSSEVDLSITQERLISSLVQRLNATVTVNVSYARLLRELLPVPRDPAAPVSPQLRWISEVAAPAGPPARPAPAAAAPGPRP